MPLYTYRREDGTTFDYRQAFSDEPLTVDPQTGQAVVRIVQAASIVFKGSGFYVNDSKSKSTSTITPPKKPEGSESSNGDSAASSTATESKPVAEKVADKAPAAAD
jgi:predicted nucleic acid-binding Zn ribbon protein